MADETERCPCGCGGSTSPGHAETLRSQLAEQPGAEHAAPVQDEATRRRLLAAAGGLEGQAARLAHVEQHPGHVPGL